VTSGGGAFVYSYETDSRNCECFGDEPSGSAGVLSRGNKIDVSVTGIPLGQVAAQFDRLLARDVLIRAARIRQTVHIRLKGVSVSAAINALGAAPRRA